jgi:hypothetical protein
LIDRWKGEGRRVTGGNWSLSSHQLFSLIRESYFLWFCFSSANCVSFRKRKKTRVARFFLTQYSKTREKYQITTTLPNCHRIHIPNDRKIYQMTITYTSIFHSKALQNLPKLGFLVWKQTIWQPWKNTFLSPRRYNSCSKAPNTYICICVSVVYKHSIHTYMYICMVKVLAAWSPLEEKRLTHTSREIESRQASYA